MSQLCCYMSDSLPSVGSWSCDVLHRARGRGAPAAIPSLLAAASQQERALARRRPVVSARVQLGLCMTRRWSTWCRSMTSTSAARTVTFLPAGCSQANKQAAPHLVRAPSACNLLMCRDVCSYDSACRSLRQRLSFTLLARLPVV